MQLVLSFFAQPGDTVKLAPGSYTGLTFSNQSFGGITITSADPTNQAVLKPFGLSNVSGLSFDHVDLDATGAVSPWEFTVANSTDIHFDHVSVHGSLDNDPTNDANGILFTGSSNISVTNSEFQQLGRASVAVLQGSNIQIAGNSFHDIRTDGIDLAQVDHITVANNSFTNFHPATGDHSDAVQLWTTNTTAPSHDVTISGNVIVVTNGAGVQGIFMRDGDGSLAFQNVTISNNLLYGTEFNGITTYYVNGLTVTGNELLGMPGKANETRIVLHNSDSVTLVENDAPRFVFDHDTNLTETNDTINLGVNDMGAAAMQTFALVHPETSLALSQIIELAPVIPVSTPVTVPTLPTTPSIPTSPEFTVPNLPFVVTPMTFMPGGFVL